MPTLEPAADDAKSAQSALRISMSETPSAKVWVSRIIVRGFRCLEEVEVDLEPNTTFLVGENNTGKSSLLLAISSALGKTRPTVDDLARSQDGTLSEKAEVDLFVRSSEGDTFGEYERGAFAGNVRRLGADSFESAAIRTTFTPSREGGQLLVNRCYLQPGRHELEPSPTELHSRALATFECEMLDASRDLVADLGNRSSRWGRVLFDLQIPEEIGEDGLPSLRSRSALESALAELSLTIRDASPVLKQLQEDLSRLGAVQNTVGTVSLMPFPPNIAEVMRSVEILLSNGSLPGLPLRFHGMGSRSLASLFVFSTLCSLRVGADSGLRPHFLTLIEEPEAHLHPQAITALHEQLKSMPGQRVVSTHSSHLISEAHPKSIRVLRRGPVGQQVLKLSVESLADTAKFRRFVSRPFGELFFSQLVVFGDGASERDALPLLLAAAMGAHPASFGITIVDCESMNHPQVPKLVAAVSELGIPWVVFGDNDDAGNKALSKLLDPDTNSPLTEDSPRFVSAGAKAIERLLLDSGYQDEIKQVAKDESQENLATEKEMLNYLKSNKGWVGAIIVEKALGNAKPLPPSINLLATRIQSMLSIMPLNAEVAK
jgi:putative ATP-dependent endonuclease of the OLD family